MAATVQIISYHGAGAATENTITSSTIRYKQADDDTQDTSNPVPVPTSGTNYSYAKWTKIKVTSAPTGDITNLRWFSDGVSWGTGVDLYVGKTATYTQSTAATLNSVASVVATTYVAATPLTINAGTVLSATTGTGTQDYVCTQVRVTTTASAGVTAARAYTYRYDET